MKREFEYKVDTYIRIWQRTDLKVIAGTQEEADALVKTLVKKHPLSLDNGNDNITTGGVEYLCDTESLVNSTTERATVEVYHADCEFYEPPNALYTNRQKETPDSINKDFQTLTDIRENYNSKLHEMLSGILEREKAPVILADEEDEIDDETDVVVAYSGSAGANNARVLSVWLNEITICMKVENIDCFEVVDIDESDLEDDGLYFIINRILTPVNQDSHDPA